MRRGDDATESILTEKGGVRGWVREGGEKRMVSQLAVLLNASVVF